MLSFRFCFYLAILSSGSIVGLVNYKKLTSPFKILTLFLSYTFISEIVSRVLAHTIRNSCPAYHGFVLANYCFYAAIFYHLLKGPLTRKIVLWSIIPFTCFWLINLIFLQHPLEFPTYSLMVASVLYVIYALTLFLQMLETPTEIAIFKQNIFWFNICVLFYTIVILASFSIAGYMAKHHIDNRLVSRITEFVTYLNYAVLGYAVVTDKNRSTNMANQSL